MSNEMKEYSRGDLAYKGQTLVQVSRGQVRFVSGSGTVNTLRGGVDGFYKGTKIGTISFTQGILKAGMRENFIDAINSQNPVTITAVISDNLQLKVTGPITSGDFDLSESSFVNGNFSITGRITPVKI